MLSLGCTIFLSLAPVLADRCGPIMSSYCWKLRSVRCITGKPDYYKEGGTSPVSLFPFLTSKKQRALLPRVSEDSKKIRRPWIPESSWEGKLPADQEYLHRTVLRQETICYQQ